MPALTASETSGSADGQLTSGGCPKHGQPGCVDCWCDFTDMRWIGCAHCKGIAEEVRRVGTPWEGEMRVLRTLPDGALGLLRPVPWDSSRPLPSRARWVHFVGAALAPDVERILNHCPELQVISCSPGAFYGGFKTMIGFLEERQIGVVLGYLERDFS